MQEVAPPCPSALEPLESRLLLSAASLEPSLGSSAPFLPPMVEQESLGGPANDEAASAESLAFGWLLPYPSYTDGFGDQFAIVQGQGDGAGGGEPFSGFRTVYGQLYAGKELPALFADAPAPASDGLLRLSVKANLSGDSNYLDLRLEGYPLGRLFGPDGINGVNSVELVVPMDALKAAAGDGTLEFAVKSSQAVTSIGVSFVSMSLSYETGSGGADFYRFDLQAGQSVDLSLAGGGMEMELWGPDMTVQSRASATDGQALIAGFQAAATGTYYVRVTGGGSYTLQAVRSELPGAGEPGEILADPLAGQGPQGDNWQSAGGTLSEGDRDYFAVTAETTKPLVFHASVAKGSPQWLTMTLYDSAGNVVATSKGPHLEYKGLPGETYHLEVTSLDGTVGDYGLSVMTPKGKGK